MRILRFNSPTLALAMAAALGIAAAAPLAAQDDVLRRTQEASELRTNWIIGSSVTTPDGETVGTLDELLVDEEAGSVTGAVISVGGFLGFGAKQIAVEWERLDIAYDGFEVTLPITVEQADEAPEFAFRDQQQPPPPPGVEPAAGGGIGGAPQGGVGGAAPQ